MHVSATLTLREKWWQEIINLPDIGVCAELAGLSEDELYMTLLGRRILAHTDLRTFRIINYRFLRNAAVAYKRAISYMW